MLFKSGIKSATQINLESFANYEGLSRMGLRPRDLQGWKFGNEIGEFVTSVASIVIPMSGT